MRKSVILIALVVLGSVALAANASNAAPYALTWKATAGERSVSFALSVADATTGKLLFSPRINTQTSFQITSDPDEVADTTFVVSGKPLGSSWELTLKATRSGSVIQETTYTATVPQGD